MFSLARRVSSSVRSSALRRSSLAWRSLSSQVGEQEPREAMDYDVAIVGAGPAGLSAAIRLKQLAEQANTDISVCVLEKGCEVGAHILSGNCLEPKALDELLPQWREIAATQNLEQSSSSSPSPTRMAPFPHTSVTEERMLLLTERSAIPLPVPPQMHNTGNFIVSLGQVVRWLGSCAEEMGVEIFPGFTGSELIFDDHNRVVGVATGDMGIAKDGSKKQGYARGMEIRAKQVFLAEGCRGSLTKHAISHFHLSSHSQPQTYGLGVKEVWEILPQNHSAGKIEHTIGWPLPRDVYGGSFLYHAHDNKVFIGFVVGLDYNNPYISPYQEFQRFKSHPSISSTLRGGKCVQYGARSINEGGLQSIPRLSFPGGVLVGCSAGFVNVPKVKGTHTAMKSGMLAAEAVFEKVLSKGGENGVDVTEYEERLKASYVYDELNEVRNVRPAFHWGFWPGLAYSGLETMVLRGRVPWTLKHPGPDHLQTKPASQFQPISYPKPDNEISFDLLSNLALSGTNHDHDSPAHLIVRDSSVPPKVNHALYAAPESRFCPAKVYEYTTDDDGSNPKLVINAQNCLHCKACDIKDPTQNITWTVPEGGGGPKYTEM